jgi:hypothetical protein
MTKITKRGYLEIDEEVFMNVDDIFKATNRDELLKQATNVVLSDLKDTLHGLGPIFGRERLLGMAAKVIDEDFSAEGQQTPLPSRAA